MEDLLPNGLRHYFAGGLLLGCGIGLIYLLTGRIGGVSSFLTAVQSWWSRRPVFRTARVLEERTWKGVLVAGLVLGALAHTLITGSIFVTQVQVWRLAAGGLLVGLGTRVARGCTSGHGICGNASFAAPSLAATAVFMAVAIVTARIVMSLGVTP